MRFGSWMWWWLHLYPSIKADRARIKVLRRRIVMSKKKAKGKGQEESWLPLLPSLTRFPPYKDGLEKLLLFATLAKINCSGGAQTKSKIWSNENIWCGALWGNSCHSQATKYAHFSSTKDEETTPGSWNRVAYPAMHAAWFMYIDEIWDSVGVECQIAVAFDILLERIRYLFGLGSLDALLVVSHDIVP